MAVKQPVVNELSIEGEPVERVWICVLPAGTELLTPDFNVVTLKMPLRIKVPDEALETVD
jgi:hypothetical protein